jgi:L-tartrate/succinate antiporter
MLDELSTSVATVTPVPAKKNHSSKGSPTLRLVGSALGVAVAVALFLAPSTQHIPATRRAVISVLGLSILFWMFSVFENHIVGLLMMGLFVLIRVPSDIAFFGYATSTFWILLASFYFGFVMEKRGVAKRIGLIVLRLFHPSYATILLSFFLIGTALSLVIAVGTVRVAIMIPLAWSLVKKLGLPERSTGSALLVISACEMALVPGFATLTGSIDGMTYAGLFRTLGLPISWLEYAKVAAIPTLICCLIILAGNLLLLRKEFPICNIISRDVEEAPLRALTRDQKWTLLIAVGSVLLWSTEKIHGIDAAGIALFSIVSLYATGVITPAEMESGISWRLVLFIGAILSLSKVISSYGIEKLAGEAVFAKFGHYLVNPLFILLLIPPIVFLLRFVLITSLLTCVTVFVAVYEPLAKTHVPPVTLAFAIMISSLPFWFLYQNFWIAMAEGITDERAFTPGQQAKMATIYGGAVVVALVASIGYWRLIGLI